MHPRPQLLETTHTIDVGLPSGRRLALPHCSPRLPLWEGDDPPEFSFGGKAFLKWGREPIFAEIFILRLLESAGWRGVWVSSYGGRKFIRDMPRGQILGGSSEATDVPVKLLDDIAMRTGSRGGCLDVFAWRDDEVLFCEAKRRGRDSLRKTQLRWLDCALETGVPESAFLVAEWSPLDEGTP